MEDHPQWSLFLPQAETQSPTRASRCTSESKSKGICPESKEEMESLKCDKGLQREILSKEQIRVTRNPKEAGISDLHVQRKPCLIPQPSRNFF